MYEYGRYRGSIVVALVLIVACVLFRPHRSHDVDGTQIRLDRLKPDESQIKLDRPKPDETQLKPQGSKLEGTAIKIDRYASVAIPAWAREHRGRDCPDTIDDLNKYIGAGDSLDLWGRPIKLLCGPTMPRGLSGFSLVSAGEDGKLGTNDDLASF